MKINNPTNRMHAKITRSGVQPIGTCCFRFKTSSVSYFELVSEWSRKTPFINRFESIAVPQKNST